MEYVCIAAVYGGNARCGNLAERGSDRCALHPEAAAAPQPDVILVKVNLSKRWDQRFEQAGIPLELRTPQAALQLAAEHEARAQQLGYDPFARRMKPQHTRGQWIEPESADSGTPVFGKGGAQKVSITGLAEELKMHDYHLINAHRLHRTWKFSIQLVLSFAKDAEEILFPWKYFNDLINTCFEYVHVWANPRDIKGIIVHTVNCVKYNDHATPQYSLTFVKGYWKLAAAAV